MAPKKKEQQKMSLGDFLGEGTGGSWADEVEESYVPGTQPLPPSDRSRTGGTSQWESRGYSVRETVPQRIPDRPPYTAHLGNLSYDATQESVTEFFDGCEVVSVRIIEDRELQRPKGFGYVEFGTADGLKKALELDNVSFQGRMIKIKIADPPRGGMERDPTRGDSIREMGNWARTGPLTGGPDPPARMGRQNSDFGERRAPREFAPAEPKPQRDFNWERKGPLSPLPQETPRGPPEGLGERSESRGGRRQSQATWGEGRPEGSRPRQDPAARPERPDRPERTATAADKDMQWRDRMRPDAAAKSPELGQDASTPSSPVPQAAVPAQRPRLNLAKRTVSEATDLASPSLDSKASPFGAARPINTAAREQEIEDKRLEAIKEKKEADEKAKEDRRLAKEAAAAEAAAAKEAAATEEASKQEAAPAEGEAAKEGEAPKEEGEQQNGETKVPIRNKEPRDAPKRPFEGGNWRSASSDQRGARGGPRGGRGGRGDRSDGPRGGRNDRGPRSNGPPPARQQENDDAAPSKDDDGWTTVKKGRQGKPLAP